MITETDTSSTTNSNVSITYCYSSKIKCEKCDGTGYQQRDDGVFVVCPICNGAGYYEITEDCNPSSDWWVYPDKPKNWTIIC